MNNPILADSLLSYFLAHKGELVSLKTISTNLQQPIQVIDDIVGDIYEIKPKWLYRASDEEGNDRIGLQNPFNEEVQYFYKKGGFKHLNAEHEKELRQKEETQNLQKANWIATTQQAQQAIKDAMLAKKISILSIIIAAVAALAALISLFK